MLLAHSHSILDEAWFDGLAENEEETELIAFAENSRRIDAKARSRIREMFGVNFDG